MVHDDPFAGLDDVPWAELAFNHNGSTYDVPGSLRALQAGESPLGWNHLVHQGTGYLPNGYDASDRGTPAQVDRFAQWVAEADDVAERERRTA